MTYTIDYSTREEPFTLPEEEGRRILRELRATFEENKLAPFLKLLAYANLVAARTRARLDLWLDETEKTGVFRLTAKNFSVGHDSYAREMLHHASKCTPLQISTQNGLVTIECKADLK